MRVQCSSILNRRSGGVLEVNMKKALNLNWVFIVLFLSVSPMGMAHFDFYVDTAQAKAVYGLDTDQRIFYVKDGQVNTEAPNFHDKRVIYDALSIHVAVENEATTEPTLNVSSTGFVPREAGAFQLRLKCSQGTDGMVEFVMQIKFALKNQIGAETLNFRRKKQCLAKSDSGAKTRNGTDDASWLGTWWLEKPFIDLSESSSTTVVALGAAAGTVALLFVLLTVMYLSQRRKVPRRIAVSSLSLLSAQNSRPYPEQYQQIGVDRIMIDKNDPARKMYSTLNGMSGSHKESRGVPISNSKMKSRTIQGHPVSARWLSQYGSNPSSIWSSQTMSSTVRTSSGHRSASSAQGTLYGHGREHRNGATSYSNLDDTDRHYATLRAHPQKNALVMENGVPKLCPTRPVSLDEAMGPTVAQREPIYGDPRSVLSRSNPIPEMGHDTIYEDEDQEASSNGPFALYSPQIYPHLMPQNFARAQQRKMMQRSSSGGSVLV